MTRNILKEPPIDWSDYIGAPDRSDLEQTELNLRDLIRMGERKIKAINFDVSIIDNLESEILKEGYMVFVIPSNVVAYADFYLLKPSN